MRGAAQFLGVGFRAFQLRRRLARAEDADIRRRQRIGNAGNSGPSGPTTTKLIFSCRQKATTAA